VPLQKKIVDGYVYLLEPEALSSSHYHDPYAIFPLAFVYVHVQIQEILTIHTAF
jgi:hypothetical protein